MIYISRFLILVWIVCMIAFPVLGMWKPFVVTLGLGAGLFILHLISDFMGIGGDNGSGGL